MNLFNIFLWGEYMHNKIIKTINATISEYNEINQIWYEPIIEIISAKNEKLKELKKAVSSEHYMPCDILPDAKSIISFFIPFQENIVKSNINGTMASKEWIVAYIQTNDLIKAINDKIEELMKRNGYKTGKIPATHNFNEKTLISNWSHRHIANLAGIGTFGINNMLITKKGCCGRLGSIIINYEFKNYKEIIEIGEKCLNKLGFGCGICHKRCIVNAYENKIFNKNKCYEQCLKNADCNKEIGYADVCGKCLVNLPCSSEEPKRV
jgi:epoxyqueuosine reductase QueG